MDVNEVSTNELLQVHELIWNCTLNFIKPMSLKCAIELGIPDIINNNHDQSITLTKLISKLPIHPLKSHCIRRLMRFLVHFGFFTITQPLEEEEEETYSLTLVSRLLLKDGPMRATPLVLSQLNPLMITPWHSLSAWLRSDTEATAFEMVHGTKAWEMLGHEPELSKDFNESMAIDSNLISKIVLDQSHVFEGLESLVDVGGGTGIMAKAIAKAFPEIQCTVLDLPYLVANVEGSNNLKFVGGDMFEAIPQANAILLKWILHDWNDDEALMILKRCREAINWSKDKGGKIIIIDVVIDQSQTPNKIDKKSTETQLFFDMLMMVNLTGRERNQKEWESLFYAAGFSHHKISPIVGFRSLIEVYP